jgi:hypothetical protein
MNTEDLRSFADDGYIVVRQMFTPAEIEALRDRFMDLHAAGPIPGLFEPKPQDADGYDPLREYPRMMHPHLVDELAWRTLTEPRVRTVIDALLGEPALAAQSMFYFKPPGARGQAAHQDNFYLKVQPGTCIAAWIACDEIDRDNGGLEVVPGTHRMDLFCPDEADPSLSFTREYVPPPPGLQPVPVDMHPGDVLFFNGSLVHGSGPNRTTDRFRRSFIGHYVGRSVKKIASEYPVMTMGGRLVPVDASTGGGPCGTEYDTVGVPH